MIFLIRESRDAEYISICKISKEKHSFFFRTNLTENNFLRTQEKEELFLLVFYLEYDFNFQSSIL